MNITCKKCNVNFDFTKHDVYAEKEHIKKFGETISERRTITKRSFFGDSYTEIKKIIPIMLCEQTIHFIICPICKHKNRLYSSNEKNIKQLDPWISDWHLDLGS